jgi:PPOX class probable F420-dependent enzyme
MQGIPQEYQDLLLDETKAFAVLATIMPDGSPQATPVWFNTDGDHILINTAKGRVKDQNMRARPQVALAIFDPEDIYRYVQVRGRVVAYTEQGGREHFDHLAKIYLGGENPYSVPEDVRLIYKILPNP